MRRKPLRIFVGFDAAEMVACTVAVTSIYQHTVRSEVRVDRLSRLLLWQQYTRPTMWMPNGQLFDEISGAPMSTDHAIARFFVPFLCDYQGWAVFVDGDILCRADIRELFALAEDRYAIQVVQHPPLLEEGLKKNGLIQQAYPRKNQSSCMLINCGHQANQALTLEVLNAWPGRDLHAFRWLPEDLIGALPSRWNWLVGLSPYDPDPAIVHYTKGTPDLPGHEQEPYAEDWYALARSAGYHLDREKVSLGVG